MQLWEAVRNALPGQEPLNLGAPPDSFPNKLLVTDVCELSGGNPQGDPHPCPSQQHKGTFSPSLCQIHRERRRFVGAQHPDAAQAAQPAPKPARQGQVCSQHLGVAAGAVEGVGTRPNAPGWAPAPQGSTSALCQLLPQFPKAALCPLWDS